VVADIATTDKLARTAVQLLHTFAKFNDIAAGYYRGWVAEMAARAKQAQIDGDLRDDLDPRVFGEFIVSALFGVEVISASAVDAADLVTAVTRAWEILLPGIVAEASLEYFRAYLARQSRRHPQSAVTNG
jgi:hypothetical protein